MGIHMHFQISDPVTGLRRFCRFSQKHPDPCRKLLECKGLHQVIIRPCIQSVHPVFNAVLCRQKQHRRADIFAPQLPEDRESVHDRHHDIQHRSIILRTLQIFKRLLSVETCVHTVMLRFQPGDQYSVQIFFIFCDQNPHNDHLLITLV